MFFEREIPILRIRKKIYRSMLRENSSKFELTYLKLIWIVRFFIIHYRHDQHCVINA